MSDRLLSRLADHLGLSESEVAPILKALLKQVRKRAESGSGVQIPNLGTFSTDSEGRLHFKPADTLVETVNEDYAGLEAEPAPEPARPPDTSTALAEPTPDPPASSSSSKDDDATEELPASSTSPVREEADDDATEELQAPGETSTGSDTGSLWPSEANTPTSPDEEAELDEGESDDDAPDSDFWSQDREWDLSKVAFGDAPDEDEYEDENEPAPASDTASDTTSESSPSVPSTDVPEPSGDADAISQGAGVPDDVSGDDGAPQRTTWRTTVGILLVLAALIGGWIVLGEQGTVPAPSTVAERVRTSFSGGSSDAPSEPSDTAPDETNTDSPESSSSDDNSPNEVSSEGETDALGSTDEGAASDSPSEDRSSVSEDVSSVIPEEGGWTLVVASRTSESEAEELESIFVNSLQEAGLPVDILPSESPDGTMRYRVVVGQFDSQGEARSMQQEYSDVVPDDAWALQL